MDVEKAKEARSLLCDLDVLEDIQSVIEKENNHWWKFITPDTKQWGGGGIQMPQVLRDEFEEAVKRAIEKTEKTLKDL